MLGLFITGTSTGVGKTHVGALIARALVKQGYRVGVYKPIASGCRRDSGELVADDAVRIWEAAGRPGTLAEVCPQRFAAPVSPPLAAQFAGSVVDPQLLRTGLEVWQERSDIVLVEGAGGLMSPLSEVDYNANLAEDFGFPLVVVAANELGTINATLQTLITAKYVAPRLPIAGVILNRLSLLPDDESTSTNAAEIVRRGNVPLLATVTYGQQELRADVDWYELARRLSHGEEHR